jgi:hypothetical protein
MTLTLPNFMIIGAAKSGTTSLVEMLRQHPQVFFPFAKEPMFFSHDPTYNRGLEWYARTYFKKAQKYPARGEATPHYLHWSAKTAPRIQDAYPNDDIRFIAIFRNPVERAYSWYWNSVKEGLEELSFKDALAAETERLQLHAPELERNGWMTHAYFQGGCYASQLKPFLEKFQPEKFLFLLQEDLRKDFGETSKKLLSFLGVDPEFCLQPLVSNPAGMPRSRAIQRLIKPPKLIRNMLAFLFSLETRYKIKESIREANIRPVTYPPMNPDTRRALQEKYAEEIKHLEALIGRDLSAWLK